MIFFAETVVDIGRRAKFGRTSSTAPPSQASIWDCNALTQEAGWMTLLCSNRRVVAFKRQTPAVGRCRWCDTIVQLWMLVTDSCRTVRTKRMGGESSTNGNFLYVRTWCKALRGTFVGTTFVHPAGDIRDEDFIAEYWICSKSSHAHAHCIIWWDR